MCDEELLSWAETKFSTISWFQEGELKGETENYRRKKADHRSQKKTYCQHRDLAASLSCNYEARTENGHQQTFILRKAKWLKTAGEWRQASLILIKGLVIAEGGHKNCHN